jgi:hypothetical protein
MATHRRSKPQQQQQQQQPSPRLDTYSGGRRPSPREERSNESRWQPRSDHVPLGRMAEFERYPTVTAHSLRTRSERPRRVKMLMRDFIHGMRPGGARRLCRCSPPPPPH